VEAGTAVLNGATRVILAEAARLLDVTAEYKRGFRLH
jgi:hypothetical protein